MQTNYDSIITKMMSQLTEVEAIELCNSNWWQSLGMAKAAFLQLNQTLLCMPFTEFHESVNFLLGRGVYTHEFVNPNSLIAEAMGSKESPSLQDIIDLLPADKLIVLKVGQEPQPKC